MTTAPPLTRILPAALRLIVIVLSFASPRTVSTRVLASKDAVTAIVLVLFELRSERTRLGCTALVCRGGARFKRDCADSAAGVRTLNGLSKDKLGQTI